MKATSYETALDDLNMDYYGFTDEEMLDNLHTAEDFIEDNTDYDENSKKTRGPSAKPS